MSAEQSRLLIIEDEEAFARFVTTVATAAGYAVRAVADSRDVEFQLSEWKPTVLFIDVFMPDRDGLELLGLLQKHAYDGQIVMMSGADSLYLNMAAASAKARGLRLAGILPKPCRKKEVEEILQRVAAAA
jgi:DNA-binding response OmpR family regulator